MICCTASKSLHRKFALLLRKYIESDEKRAFKPLLSDVHCTIARYSC